MTKRIFRSIFLVAMAVMLAATGLIMGALHSYFTDVQFRQLRVETALAAHALTNEGVSYFEKLDGTMDCRITWIAADGSVLYDNRSDTGTMENHLAREEVHTAFAEGYGQSVRLSDTLLERYIYAAELLPDGTVLRLSTSQNSVLNLALGIFRHILLAIFMTVVLSYWLAGRLSRSIVRPINTLDLDDPLANREYEEIRPLLRRLDSQQVQLRNQAAELKRKQKEFDTVTRALSEGLVLINGSGTILSINPAAARLLEVTPNCAGADFHVANRNPEIAMLVEKARAGEKTEQTVLLKAGAFLAAARPVRAEGSLIGGALLLVDMTQKHQAEQLRREFTANVSHELKTPLHAISGYAELLQSGLVPPEDTRKFSEKIYSEAGRMICLVEDILRLSRLDEGAADMQWADVDLYAAAENTIRQLESAAELARMPVRLEGGAAGIRAIPQLVNAILFNLLDNAVKYNRPGGVVTVRVADREQNVVLTVTDNGIGIPEEYRERVFERYYRVDKSHSKAVGGTGLGLSIVKHAAQILKAEVKLDSSEGKGTTVTVVFSK